MASSLRDELASLKIERKSSEFRRASKKSRPGRPFQDGGGIGLRLLSLALWLVPLSLLGVGGTFAYKQYQNIRSKPEVQVGLVQAMTTGEAEKLLSAKGYLKSRNQAMIGAKVPGRVLELKAEEGSRVKKGQLLAVLEHNDLDAQLESRKAMAARAQADLQECKSDLEYKQTRADRSRKLNNKNIAVPIEELQQNTSAVDMAVAHLASLEASVRLQHSQVREVEEAIRNMNIYAPFDGTVVEKPAEVGEMITGGGMGSGLSIGRASVLTLANLEQMDVETDVAENLLSRIVPGQPAEISVSAVPSKHYQGRLRQIIPISDRASGMVKVKVEVIDPDEHLFPNLIATVHFLPDKKLQSTEAGKSYVFMPKAALFEEDGHSNVWKIDAKDVIHKTRVEVVVTNDDLARVESGVSGGDMVVLNPTLTLRDGEIIKKAD